MLGIVHKPTVSTPSSAGAKPTIPLMSLKSNAAAAAAAGAKSKGSTPSSATAVEIDEPKPKVYCYLCDIILTLFDITSDIVCIIVIIYKCIIVIIYK
jgi:hypothetical protein